MNRYAIKSKLTNFYTTPGNPAQPNLAVTPSSMLELANHGLPIASQQNPNNFDDGNLTPSPVLPENLRGVDCAQLWELQQNVRNKAKKIQ